ncbi:biotin/lipoate A/B protein ligase family protein [Nesterenkonia sp. HG001]|uniref:lipoate--protein ligase family protein n=1 Tax=Nesterenkonia sp. HG001 TaxID=2983207 RepID=UPI002AC43DAB|nr:biotin/lipoate A/B protein ligase family protein [Nesterenkonia sp. HG001]MDZ5077997.1 lipoate--protein ligase family protein [Nesterenkonia sp. HG001]
MSPQQSSPQQPPSSGVAGADPVAGVVRPGTGATRHGEYKVAGGKLVVVDLTVDEEARRIAAVSVNGDFFLEPDDALLDLNRSLVGLDVDAGRETIARAVEAGMPDDAQMFGFDAGAVGIAVRRALGHATSWEDHEWEILPPMKLPIALNVALDQVLTEEVGRGNRPPLLRLWDWSERAVVIGSFQSLINEVDADAARATDTTVVRRISGGGAMFMEPGNCVTYSLCVPQSLVDGMSFADSYPFLDSWVMEALREVGVEASYKPLNDIVSAAEGESRGRKIGGAAQKRLASGAMLHHVTMSYDIDAEKMLQILRIGREKISDKGITSAVKRVDPLRSQTGRSREEILETFMEVFGRRYGARPAAIRDAEMVRARQLVEEKFGTEAWTSRVP